MKGASETITDTLTIVGAMILILALVIAIAPVFLDFIKSAALDSSSFVSKEVAELITVSAAAPGSIDITYQPSNAKYNVEINSRIVKVSLINTQNQQVQDTSSAKIGVDASGSFNQVNVFGIRKAPLTITGGGGIGPTSTNEENEISIQAS
jgi:hypothetical protein